MNCEDIFEKTDEYLDGQLSADECAAFEEHMATCESCRKSVEFAKSLNSVMDGMPSVEPPEDFLETLHKKIAAERKTVRFYKKWQPYSALAACILLAVVIRTNVAKDLNDSGAYLNRETPSPTVYSQTAGALPDKSADSVRYKTAEDTSVPESTPAVPEGTPAVNESAAPSARPVKNSNAASKAAQATKAPVKEDVPETVVSTPAGDSMPVADDNVNNAQEKAAPEQDNGGVTENTQEKTDEKLTIPSLKSASCARSNDSEADSAVIYGAVQSIAETKLPQTEHSAGGANKASSGSSGGGSGGGSSTAVTGAAAMPSPNRANIIDKKHKDTVLAVISELGIDANGSEYTASDEEYEQFTKKLSELGILFNGICTRREATVYFVIEWK